MDILIDPDGDYAFHDHVTGITYTGHADTPEEVRDMVEAFLAQCGYVAYIEIL